MDRSESKSARPSHLHLFMHGSNQTHIESLARENKGPHYYPTPSLSTEEHLPLKLTLEKCFSLPTFVLTNFRVLLKPSMIPLNVTATAIGIL